MTAPRPGKVRRALTDPSSALSYGLAILKGHWYKFWFPLRGFQFKAGDKLRVFGSLVMKGPGQVVIGDNVVLYGKSTPWTYAPTARISIGNNCVLDGVRFGCRQSISIGNDCLLAESHLLDTDFHSTRSDRRTNREAPVRTASVTVEDNVWIAAGAALLPGTVIGRNCVVGYGAVCVRRFPPNVIIFGNPAAVVAPVAVPEDLGPGT